MKLGRVALWSPLILAATVFVWPSPKIEPAVDPVPTAAIAPEAPVPPATPAVARPATGKVDRLAPLDVARLKGGLDALESGAMDEARAIRDAAETDRLDRRILTWAIALRGGPDVSGEEIRAAAAELSDWPGVEALQRNAERAMLRETPEADAIVAAFAESPPRTVAGTIRLARAHVQRGDLQAAAKLLAPVWRTDKLDASEETAILREFGSILSVADHRARMERMLYAERLGSAQRVADAAQARRLFQAWAAVIRGEAGAARLLKAVPESEHSPGYLFALTRHLRRGDRFDEAVATMLKAPTDRDALGDPDAWWLERRALSRELLDKGDPKAAYTIVAAHAAETPVNQADAEFHAGWYALRSLGDPNTAARHFARIAEVSGGPISLARSFYWQGRAAEAGGPGHAADLYRRAARYGTTFYGQLAAAKAGLSKIDVAHPSPRTDEASRFAGREAVRAIRRLEAAGYPARADMLYRDLAAQLTSPGEIELLASMAARRGNHHLALKIAKTAAQRGIEVGALSHPLGAIPESADMSGSGKALAYAIARQESEFNAGAVSGAGARGLLQLLPTTARDVARKSGLAYSAEKLASDAAYNATLGSAFLGEQLDRFDGSYVMTFAGYNAGPRRASQWAARYGDPRGKDVETVVDWIERIPFAETRGYVQRVMENYQVYKMRLTGKVDIERDLTQGR